MVGVSLCHPSRISQSLLGSGDAVDDELIDLALFLRLEPIIRVERTALVTRRHLAGNLGREVGNVKTLDRPCARLTFEQTLPRHLYITTERRDRSDTRDDDPPHFL